MSLRTIIVEDEPLSRAFLNNLLSEFCPAVSIIATVPSEAEAVEAIKNSQPDLVFLDIELQQGTGFDVLKHTQDQQYHVIFTTAIEHYGIRVIKFSGVDYLQKPIDIQGLQSCIESVMKKQPDAGAIAVKHLIETLDNNNIPLHLMVSTDAGEIYVPVSSIIYIEAVEGTCIIHDGLQKIVSINRSFKEYEQMLTEYDFIRPHHSFIVNLNKVDPSSKPETGFITLTGNSTIPVSPKKTEELKQALTGSGKRNK